MALSKVDLLGILDDLADEDLERFKFYLRLEQKGATMTYSGIPRSSLERASRVDVVELMAEMYTGDLAQITAGILVKMRKRALRDTLVRRTVSTSVAAESDGFVYSLQPVTADSSLVSAIRLEFIACWSQNKEQMSRVLSDLFHIQVQILVRSQQTMVPTFSAMFALGAALSFITVPALLPGFFLASSLFPVTVGLAAYQGLATGGAGVMYCKNLNQRQDQSDQSRARELETELGNLLEQLLEKLLPLLSAHLSQDCRILVQGAIRNIQKVLQANCGSTAEIQTGTGTESTCEWISGLIEKGHVILRDLGSIEEKLDDSQNMLTAN